MEQRFTFDAVADLYDRSRPGYPPELVSDLLALANVPSGASILEIGCGTGQLTPSLASRGHRLLCLEPGKNLARLAERKLQAFASIQILQETFEAWRGEPETFDLVVAAQSFHWVAPEVRFEKAAQVLRANGAIGVIGNVAIAGNSPLQDAIQQIYAKHAPSLVDIRPMQWYDADGPLRDLFAESRHFVRVESRRYPWSRSYSASEYTDLLDTYSDHRLLPEIQRAALLDGIREAIQRHGGSITVQYEAHLHLGRRANGDV